MLIVIYRADPIIAVTESERVAMRGFSPYLLARQSAAAP